jgi:phosphatidylglycerol lysyltransferase
MTGPEELAATMGQPARSRSHHLQHWIAAAIALLLFAGALWVLHREMRAYRLEDILAHASQLPASRIVTALLLTALGYLALTGYDYLGLVYVGRTLSYPRVALASFIAYAFSHNLGFAALTGSAVRYRLYSAWGLSALDVTRLTLLCAVTFWLGFLVLCGGAFLVEPVILPPSWGIPPLAIRVLGLLFLALLAIYVVWSLEKRTIRLRSWEFPPPPLRLSLTQIVVSCADWALIAAVLHALLPPAAKLPYLTLLSSFLLAQIVGLASHVPGGLGVFEGGMLLLLKPLIAPPALIGSLLMFRAIYYLAPFLLAIALLAVYEVASRASALRRLAGSLRAGPRR